MSKSITEFLTKIDNAAQAVLDRQAEHVSNLETRVSDSKERQAKAKEDAAKAYAAADVDAYHAAQEEDRSGKDAEAMYQQQLDNALKEPALSDADYQNYLSQIMQILAEDVQEKQSQIIGLLDQIISLAEDNQKNIEAGNKIIHKLQHDVMKDDCMLKRPDGIDVYMAHREKKFDDYSVVWFANETKQNYFYMKGKGNA